MMHYGVSLERILKAQQNRLTCFPIVVKFFNYIKTQHFFLENTLTTKELLNEALGSNCFQLFNFQIFWEVGKHHKKPCSESCFTLLKMRKSWFCNCILFTGKIFLTLYRITLQNDQTYFKNHVAFPARFFKVCLTILER